MWSVTPRTASSAPKRLCRSRQMSTRSGAAASRPSTVRPSRTSDRSPAGCGATSGEDDLPTGRQPVELADGDDILHLLDEVIAGEAEQIHRCLTGIQAGAGIGDHLDELGNRW